MAELLSPMTINDFLMLRHRFRWGGVDDGEDCMTFLATWVSARLGVDPASDLRGTYASRAGAHAIMAGYGGPLGFMTAKLEPLGCRRVQSPVDGDVGLVRMLAGETFDDVAVMDIGAICFGPTWASIGPGGVVCRRADMVAAWRLP